CMDRKSFFVESIAKPDYFDPVIVTFSIWDAIYHYGLDKLNHGYKAELIALNLTQVYEVIHGLPERKILIQQLKVSSKPYPQYMDTNLPIRSVLT
ncbi:hypothetical protein ACT453_47095, partial [Bacillus sp. D-CC]